MNLKKQNVPKELSKILEISDVFCVFKCNRSISINRPRKVSCRNATDSLDSPRRNETEDQYAAPCGLELLTLIPHGRHDRTIVTGVSRLTALVLKLARDERPVGLW